MFSAEIPPFKAFEHAAAAGVAVSTFGDEHCRRAWDAYTAVAKEVEKYAKSQVFPSSRARKAKHIT